MLHASYSSRVGYCTLAWKTEVRIRFGTCGGILRSIVEACGTEFFGQAHSMAASMALQKVENWQFRKANVLNDAQNLTKGKGGKLPNWVFSTMPETKVCSYLIGNKKRPKKDVQL